MPSLSVTETQMESAMNFTAFKPRFTMLTLLLCTALVAFAFANWRISRKLVQTRAELTSLRNEYAVLDVFDQSKIHAVELPSFAYLHWRWKLWLPNDQAYRLCYATHNIPESGFPHPFASFDQAFVGSTSMPLPEKPFILDVGFFKDTSYNWNFEIRNGPRGTRSPFTPAPAWMDSGSLHNWIVKTYGRRKTEVGEPLERFSLVRYRDKTNETFDNSMNCLVSRDGVMIWIEPLVALPTQHG
jgi:hypothetical protein